MSPISTERRHIVPAERRRQILELLRERGSISVVAVEELFGVSPMTARRDLALLAQEGRARRTHGGAVLPDLAAHEDSFDSRFEQDVAEKHRIARAVVATLKPQRDDLRRLVEHGLLRRPRDPRDGARRHAAHELAAGDERRRGLRGAQHRPDRAGRRASAS